MTAPSEPDDLLALELAFGLLAPDEAAFAERRASADEDFGRSVETWRRRAAAMIALPAQAPRPSLWPEIARRTIGDGVDRGARRSLRIWRGVSAVTTALAAAAIVMVVSRGPAVERTSPPPTSSAPSTELALLTGTGRGAMAIGYHGAQRSLTVIASGVRLGSKDAQLWVLPATGNPVSLGVLDLRGNRAVLRLRPLGGLLGAGASLAVSLEPAGGSPTGLPTGPVILTGTIEANGVRRS